MKKLLSITLYISIILISLFGCAPNSSQPTEAASSSDELPDEYPFFPTALQSNSGTANLPVTWANLNLTGRLVYGLGAVDDHNNYVIRIYILDLVTGNITTIYTVPLNGWIYYVSVSPDDTQLVMSYSPPLGENSNIVQALYTMPLDGSQPPQLLFMPPTAHDQYTQAEWSPDGKYIYYTHVNYQIPDDPNRVSPLYTIYRMAYPGGQPESIATGAYWPRLSSDSSRLVYVSADPLSSRNKLTIADSNGSNAQEVTLSGSHVPDIMEAPVFLPDGKSILFSGAAPGESYQPDWFEKFMGIHVAKANGEPSQWWSVSASGGEIAQLTDTLHSGLYASISPDHKRIASYSREGIFIMNPDGSDLTMLIPDLNGFSSTVNWIP